MKTDPQTNPPAYQVTPLDNFDWYEGAGVPTPCRDAEHALSVAKGILERSLAHEHAQTKDPSDPQELFSRWDDFGDYPSIYPALNPPFDPSEYARQRAAEICSSLNSSIRPKNVVCAADFPPGTKFYEIEDIPIAEAPGKAPVGCFNGSPRELSENTARKLGFEREISREEFDACVEKALTYAKKDEQEAAKPPHDSILTPEEREELLAACRQVEAERRNEEHETESYDESDDETDDDEDSYDPNCYAFQSEDSYPVGKLISAIRRLANRPDLPAETSENLKVFLFAMERLPLVTPGVRMGLGLRLDQAGESDWIEIRMEDGEFTLGRGSWIDGDADTEAVFEVTPDYRDGDAFVATQFAESFAECARDVCREVVIEDFCDEPFTAWDLPQGKERWNDLPCSFL